MFRINTEDRPLYGKIAKLTGPIILQKAVDLEPGMSREAIYTKIREDAESVILPEAVKLFCANKLECDGNFVHISGK